MLYWILFLSPLLLVIGYPLAIQYERGGLWRFLLPLYAAVGIASTVINFTWFSLLLWDLPRKGEITTSQRCERLVHNTDWRGHVARFIARYTNYFDPTGPHIPLP